MPRHNPSLTKDQVFDLLAAADLAKVVVHFSGGNDSGSVEEIYFLDADGKRVERPGLVADGWEGLTYQDLYDYNQDTYEWTLKPTAPDKHKLRDALEAPVYSVYGSFAGDFYVDGEVIYDVAERDVKMTRSEQVWSESESLDIQF